MPLELNVSVRKLLAVVYLLSLSPFCHRQAHEFKNCIFRRRILSQRHVWVPNLFIHIFFIWLFLLMHTRAHSHTPLAPQISEISSWTAQPALCVLHHPLCSTMLVNNLSSSLNPNTPSSSYRLHPKLKDPWPGISKLFVTVQWLLFFACVSF